MVLSKLKHTLCPVFVVGRASACPDRVGVFRGRGLAARAYVGLGRGYTPAPAGTALRVGCKKLNIRTKIFTFRFPCR
jgi:hypothetical protein